jgi:hypothetical protein
MTEEKLQMCVMLMGMANSEGLIALQDHGGVTSSGTSRSGKL